MMPKRFVALSLLALILGACVPIPAAAPPSAPAQPAAPNTPSMVSGLAAVESVEVQVLNAPPASLLVIARGYLPDGCTSIDETSWVQEGNTFVVTITTFRPADMMCTQVLVPFEETVIIEPESALSPGTYTVEVNGVSTQVVL